MIPHGVDVENYEGLEGQSVRKELGLPEEAFVLVFHGTLNYGPNRLAALYLTQTLLPELESQGRVVWLLLMGVNPPKECEGARVIKPGPVDPLPRFLAAAEKTYGEKKTNLVTASFNGAETLRVTATRGAYNANFYMLVPAPTAQPTLTIGRSGGSIVISWIGSGFVLESTTQLGGSWAPVQNQTNPFSVTPGGSAAFYRLH